jgi:Spy/CpxP family protein refolding chaperone
MKTILLLMAAMLVATSTFAANGKPANTKLSPQQTEANYTKAIEGRTAGILKALALTNTNKAARVHDIIMAQYRALNANDARLQASPKDTNLLAQVHQERKVLHAEFISKLSAVLTPKQVDIVKDKMTYDIVEVTYNAYLHMYPDLTDAEKKQIMAWLIEARESAMDGGSSKEKHAIFGKYKGRINNYLSKAGYDTKTGKKKSASPEK